MTKREVYVALAVPVLVVLYMLWSGVVMKALGPEVPYIL